MKFCPLSGLSVNAYDLVAILDEEFDDESCPLVRKALNELSSSKDITVHMVLIDLFDDSEGSIPLHKNEQMSHDEISQILDSQICVVSDDIDFMDSESGWAQTMDGTGYNVRDYTSIFVTSASLAILSLATDGKMTFRRAWRMLVHEWKKTQRRGVTGIDYFGAIPECRFEYPYVTPGFSTDTAAEKMTELELLGDIELIRRAIIWEGKFWVWIRPNLFPTDEIPHDHPIIPTILEPPTSLPIFSTIEQLPLEILIDIASYCSSLSSLLCLLSTSHHLRSKILADASDRDALARGWIWRSAPWYLPENYPRRGT